MVLQCGGVEIDRGVAALVEHAVGIEQTTAADRAAGPVEASVQFGMRAARDVQRSARQREHRCDARAIAQNERAAALGQRTGAVEPATGRNRGAAAQYLDQGASRNVLRAGDTDGIAEGQVAGFDVQHAVLHESHVAGVADVGPAGTHLCQGTGILEPTAERAGVMVDVQDAVGSLHRQRKCAAVAEHGAVLDIEAAARCVGDAAVAAIVRVYERGCAQMHRGVAALVEHAGERQHAATGDRSAGPAQVSGHGGAAAHVQRAARQVDVGGTAGHVQIDRAGIDVQQGQSEIGIDVGGIAGDTQGCRRQAHGGIEVHRAATRCQRGKRERAGVEGRGAARLVEVGYRAAAVGNELARAAAQRDIAQIEGTERFQAATADREFPSDARRAVDGQAAAGDRDGLFRRERPYGPVAAAQGDQGRVAHAVDQHCLRAGIRRRTKRPVAADRPVAAGIADPLIDAGQAAAGAQHIVGRPVVTVIAETVRHVERGEFAPRDARVVTDDAQTGIGTGRVAAFVRGAQRTAESDGAGDVKRIELAASLAAGDADFQCAGSTQHQVASHGQQAVRTQRAGVRQGVRAEVEVACAADDARTGETGRRSDTAAFKTQGAGIGPAAVAVELEGLAGCARDGGAGEGAAGAHVDVAGLAAGEQDAAADVQHAVRVVGGQTVVDRGTREIDGAVAGDVQRAAARRRVAAQVGVAAGALQTDGRAIEGERAATFHGPAIADDIQSGAFDPDDTRQRGVDQIAGIVHQQGAAGRVVAADDAAGDAAAEQHGAGGPVQQQRCAAVVQRSGQVERPGGHAVAVERIEACGIEGATEGECAAVQVQRAGRAPGAAGIRGERKGAACCAQRAGIVPVDAAELEGLAGCARDGGAGEGAAGAHVDVAGLAAGEQDAAADVQHAVRVVGGQTVVDRGTREIDGAVAGDVQRAAARRRVAAQVGVAAGALQTDGCAIEGERAATFKESSVADADQRIRLQAGTLAQGHICHVDTAHLHAGFADIQGGAIQVAIAGEGGSPAEQIEPAARYGAADQRQTGQIDLGTDIQRAAGHRQRAVDD